MFVPSSSIYKTRVGSKRTSFPDYSARRRQLLVSGYPGVRPGPPVSQDPSARRKAFFQVMNLVVFGSPDGHHKALDTIRVNHRVIWTERRGNQIDRIDYAWDWIHNIRELYLLLNLVDKINVHASLLWYLSAVNISFQTQISAILVSYLSALCATGSLVVTSVFARRVNDSQRYPARRSALQSFNSYSLSCSPDLMLEMLHSGERLRLECLDLMLSLPIAFLILGCVSHWIPCPGKRLIPWQNNTLCCSMIYRDLLTSPYRLRCLLGDIKVQILIRSLFCHARSLKASATTESSSHAWPDAGDFGGVCTCMD
jgi:hypothetical protein